MNIVQIVIVGFLLISLQLYLCKTFNLKQLDLKRFFTKQKVFPNERFDYGISIVNNKILPLVMLEVESEFPQEFLIDNEKVSQTALTRTWLHKGILSLLWFQKVTRIYSMRCIKRGYYSLPEVILTTGDFLGINTFSTKLPAFCELVVYPEYYHLAQWTFAGQPMGNFSVKRWIIDDPLQVTGVREYTPGDPLNSVHWATSARTGKLHVKKFDFTASRKIMVFLNMQTFDSYWDGVNQQLTEEIITFCASFCNHLIDAGASLGISSNGHVAGNCRKIILPDSTKRQKEKIMDYLGRLSRYLDCDLKETALTCKRNLSYGTSVYFITSKVFDFILDTAAHYAKGGYPVTILTAEREDLEKSVPGINITYFNRRKARENEEAAG